MEDIKKISNKEFYCFNQGGKEYTYPRVTAIIDKFGFIPQVFNKCKFCGGEVDLTKKYDGFCVQCQGKLEASREFGTMVHLACHYWDTGTLDEEDLDTGIIPYLEGWKKCRQQMGWKKVLLSEAFVYSHTYKYAGTLDVVFDMKTRPIVDIKTGVIDKACGLQLAPYKEALRECQGIKVHQRFGVLLKPYGYELFEFKDTSDIDVFYSCITRYNFLKGGLKI